MAQPARELHKRFKVQKFLGKGSYGSVYRILRLEDNQVYALKEMDVTSMKGIEREDAVNEIRLLASSKHENVVRYYEAFLDNSLLCIVMEFAACGDLSNTISAGKKKGRHIPEDIVWKYIIQCMRGVESLHAQKIIHRDIKPANVFVGAGDVMKIGDLGIAKILKNDSNAMTQIGTPFYMAPEIWKQQPYTLSADVWSLGCVLYEMLTYNLPFSGRSLEEIRSKVLVGRPDPIKTNYTDDVKNLVAQMLQTNPANRPTLASILQMPFIVAKAKMLPVLDSAAQRADVLNTIKVPSNLSDLSGNLPDACYEEGAPIPAVR